MHTVKGEGNELTRVAVQVCEKSNRHHWSSISFSAKSMAKETQQGSVVVIWGGILAVLTICYTFLGTILTAIIAPIALYVGINMGKTVDQSKREKRMSFVTEALARGAFPPEAKIPEPVMHAVMWFAEGLPEKADVAKMFQEVIHMKAYTRLRSVLKQHRGDIEFEVLPPNNFDVSARFREYTAKDEAEVVQIVEKLMMTDMDTTQPLWELHFIKNASGRSAIVPKVHHALGDGLSMVGLFLNFFRNLDGSPVVINAMKEPKAGKTKINYIETASKFLDSIGRMLSLPTSKFDSTTKLKDPTGPVVFSGNRRLFVSKPIDLQLVKDIKNASHTTVNDVCVAALTGAIRRYCESINDPTLGKSDLQVRALLPYGFPRIVDPKRVSSALINWWVLVSLPLPIHFKSTEVRQRLQDSKVKCDKLKASPDALVMYGLQVFASKVLPFNLQRKTNLDTMLRHTCVFTNVPGPEAAVKFAGKTVDYVDIAVLNCLPQISALSYNGQISITWCLDDKVTPNPEKLPEFFIQELVEMKKALGIEKKE
jgi:diacylglycerol O-acyltransferase